MRSMILDSGLVIIPAEDILFLFLKSQRSNAWAQQPPTKLCWGQAFPPSMSVRHVARKKWRKRTDRLLFFALWICPELTSYRVWNDFCSWKKKSEKEILNTKFQKILRQKTLLFFALLVQMKSIHLLTLKGKRDRLWKQKPRLLGKRTGRKGQKEMNRS